MKKTLIPLVIVHYLFMITGILIFVIDDTAFVQLMSIINLILVPIGLITIVMNIINAFKHRNDSLDSSAKEIMIFKILMIPYYISSFIFGVIFAFVGLISLVTIFWLASFPLVLVAILMLIYNYITMISTSSHILFKLYKEYKNYSSITSVIIAMSQLIMVIDVFGAIFLYIRVKEKNKEIKEIK